MSATLATPFFNPRDYPNNISNFRNTNTGLVNQAGNPRLPNPHYSNYASTHNSTPDLRRAAAGTPRSFQQQSPPVQNSTQPPSDMEQSGGRGRKPNWHEFYKNGLPKEVIVIDDESPPPHLRQSNSTTNPRYQAAAGSSTNGGVRHTDKKRKTAASTNYDPVYNKHYSTTQTPYYESGSTSISTDRQTSAYNTAATSLTSQASNGTWPAPADQEIVGQKRKRQTTRKTTAENKKREAELLADPFSTYIRGAPPNPPIKASEVRVPVIVPHVCVIDHVPISHLLIHI